MFTLFDYHTCRMCISINLLLHRQTWSSRCFIFPNKIIYDVSSSAKEILKGTVFFS